MAFIAGYDKIDDRFFWKLGGKGGYWIDLNGRTDIDAKEV